MKRRRIERDASARNDGSGQAARHVEKLESKPIGIADHSKTAVCRQRDPSVREILSHVLRFVVPDERAEVVDLWRGIRHSAKGYVCRAGGDVVSRRRVLFPEKLRVEYSPVEFGGFFGIRNRQSDVFETRRLERQLRPLPSGRARS